MEGTTFSRNRGDYVREAPSAMRESSLGTLGSRTMANHRFVCPTATCTLPRRFHWWYVLCSCSCGAAWPQDFWLSSRRQDASTHVHHALVDPETENEFEDCSCQCKVGMLPNLLSFRNCDWTAEHLRSFVDALPSFSKLKELDLSENKLGDEGMKILAPALKASQCFCGARQGILAAISLLTAQGETGATFLEFSRRALLFQQRWL